ESRRASPTSGRNSYRARNSAKRVRDNEGCAEHARGQPPQLDPPRDTQGSTAQKNRGGKEKAPVQFFSGLLDLRRRNAPSDAADDSGGDGAIRFAPDLEVLTAANACDLAKGLAVESRANWRPMEGIRDDASGRRADTHHVHGDSTRARRGERPCHFPAPRLSVRDHHECLGVLVSAKQLLVRLDE